MKEKINELIEMKAVVDQLKDKKARLTGQFDEVQRQLQEVYGFSDLATANKVNDEMQAELDALTEKFNKQFDEIKEQIQQFNV